MPTIVVVPASCCGEFVCNKYRKLDKGSEIYLVTVKFRDWEDFHREADRITKESFTATIGPTCIIAETLLTEKLLAVIAADTATHAFRACTNLREVDASLASDFATETGGDLLVLITRFIVYRGFPRMRSVLKYRVYELKAGDLLLVDIVDMDFEMRGTNAWVWDEIFDDMHKGRWPSRLYGLHADEMSIYRSVCLQMVGRAGRDIRRRLLRR
jgi:hypothetical protein